MDYIFNQDFVDLIVSFNKYKVKYLIVGGYSVIIHGYNRTTGDLDIWVNKTENNHKKLTYAFSAFGMPLFDMTLENFMNSREFDVFSFGKPPVSIDIMTEVKGVSFESCFSQKDIHLIQGVSVNVLSKVDLIKAKTASNRSKDKDDIEHLK